MEEPGVHPGNLRAVVTQRHKDAKETFIISRGNQTVCVVLSPWEGAQSVGGMAGYLLFEVNNGHYVQNDLTGLIIELTAVL